MSIEEKKQRAKENWEAWNQRKEAAERRTQQIRELLAVGSLAQLDAANNRN
jgi:hypothetical protein